MADAESRKERFQGQIFERNEDAILHERYLKMKQERDNDKSRDNANRVNLEDAVDIVGTCDMMCPEFESLQRYFERDLDPFEKSPSAAYDRSLMVQTFARAAAGNDLPPLEDIRPPPILRITVDYLLDNILVKHGIEATHNFIWGRTRAIRSDLTRQRDHSADAIYCLERIVRYHTLAFHVVCRGQREIETLEIEQLKKALQSLTEVYHDARSHYTSPNEPEFRSYYILMHIRSRHAPFTLRSLPSAVYNSPILQWALRIRFTLSRNSDGADEHNSDVTQMDYTGFFDILSQPSTSYLTACLLETHFDDIRRQMCLMLGLALKNTARIVTLPQFQSLLQLDTIEEAAGWISHLKWNLTNAGHVEIPQSRKADILLPSVATATAYPRTKSALVEQKKMVPGLPTHINGGMLYSIITQSRGSKFGRGYTDPPATPRQRRGATLPANRTTNQGFAMGSASTLMAPPVSTTPNPFGQQAFARMQPQAAAQQPLAQPRLQPQLVAANPFNPFGRPKAAMPSAAPSFQVPPTIQPLNTPQVQPPTQTFSSQPLPTHPLPQHSPQPAPSFAPTPAANVASSSMRSAFTMGPTLTATPPSFQSQPPVSFKPPQTTFGPPAVPSTPALVSTPASIPFSSTPPASTPPQPVVAAPVREPPQSPVAVNTSGSARNAGGTIPPSVSFTTKLPTRTKEIGPPAPVSFGHSFSFTDYETDSGIQTTPPARPFERNHLLSDGYMSASTDSSIMPASTHAHNSPPRGLTEIINIDAQSNASSASADMEAVDPELEYHAQQYDRISTLRNFVQRWRETSVKTKDNKPSEDDVKKEKAEQTALTIPLGARFTDSQPDFTKSISKKRISKRTDTTQAFMLAEKEAHDRQIWAPGTFTRIASQIAKKRRPGGDLPAGWQLWASFVPEDATTSQWFKTKLTGDKNAPDLANITFGPPANDENVAAPGLLVLHVEPEEWDKNLCRAKQLLDLLPDRSPYLPGLILTMIAHPKNADFPKTWVTKLDRLLQGVVMDRRAIVITSLESSQAIDEIVYNQLDQLKFDVDGQAPRLGLKELVDEFMNWWNVEYQYGREQAMLPTVDLDVALTVVSILMSGLDEMLRQVVLQSQRSDLDVPFNNFQSRHDIEEACIEMLDYLKALGGNIRRLPVTPAAILQEPDALFRILFRISQALKDRLLEQEDLLLLRSGPRRHVLEKLGREYNEKLERELLPIDRSALVYGQARDVEMTPSNSTSLKRKRQPSTITNGLSSSTSSPEHGLEDLSISRPLHLKRSRISLEQPSIAETPLKLSFKVEMAKARFDLRVIQAIDIDSFPKVSELAFARARTLVDIAEPLIDKVLKSDVPSDKDVVECRAIIELIAGVDQPVFDELGRVKALAISIEYLSRLSGVGNLEFRELVNSAKRLSERLPY